MRIFSRLRNAMAGFRADIGYGTPAPDSDYWYGRPGFRTASGAYVSPETAMRLAAVFACVRVISETIGSLPLTIYRWSADGKSKERANDHPLISVFRKPNTWQTGFEFWEMMQAHLELRGNAFARIMSGNGRAIDQLIPLHPDRVRVYRLANQRLRYEVTSYYDGTTTSLTQDEMFHLRGLSSDGIMGISTITAASEVVGTGLAQQEHRGRYFSNNAVPGLYLKPLTKLDKEAREVLQASIRDGFAGSNAFKAMVGQPGMEVTALGLTNKDSQLIEAGQATKSDICAMFRLQPHKIGDLSRGTFSNIEQQNIEFATDSIRPRIVRNERRIDCDLVDPVSEGLGAEPGEFFAGYDLDALFRGDMKSRYEAYNLALQYWLTVNEVRAAEGKNPVDGGDDILRPVNMQPAADDTDTSSDSNSERNEQDSAGGAEGIPDEDPDDASAAHFRALALSAATRMIRREVKGLRKIAGQQLDQAALERELGEFYAGLVDVLCEALVISKVEACAYASGHALTVSTARTERLNDVIDRIEESSAADLVAIAIANKERKHEVRTRNR